MRLRHSRTKMHRGSRIRAAGDPRRRLRSTDIAGHTNRTETAGTAATEGDVIAQPRRRGLSSPTPGLAALKSLEGGMSRIIASRLAERIEVGPLDERGLLLSGHGEAYCRDVERALDIKLPSDYRSILANVGGFVAYDAVVVRPGADALPIDVVFGESKRRGRDLVAVCREFARRLPQPVIPIADNCLAACSSWSLRLRLIPRDWSLEA